MTQYCYVDESGEPGLQRVTSSRYFVLAMVQMPNWEPIDELASLRRQLHLLPSLELHYTKMSSSQRQEFYEAVSPVLFRVRAAVILKDEAPRRYRGLSSVELIIELLTCLTLRASPLDIGNDILVIDGATDALRSALRIRLAEEYRKIRRVRPFKKIVTAISRKEDGLQLADMAACAIREMVWENRPTHYATFAGKVVDLWRVK